MSYFNKKSLLIFLIAGLTFGLLMAAPDFVEKEPFNLTIFLFNSTFFGLLQSVLFHISRLKSKK